MMHRAIRTGLGWPGALIWGSILVIAVWRLPALADMGDDAAELAGRILDDSAPAEARMALVRDHPELSVELIEAMVADLEVGTPEEYRRIPWIWRVAVAAGRRQDADEVRRLLERALPEIDAPLRDWQAVVIGGGIINGISLASAWPAARIGSILDGHDALEARWRRSLELAAEMTDDEAVPAGTRYDALRMIALEPWDRRGAQLVRYLLKGVDPELQQGAISGLADLPSPCTGQALLSGWEHYNPANRAFALDALLRADDRVATLLDALAARRLTRDDLGDERIRTLLGYPQPDLRARAIELLGD